jgi:hypothetical protein
MREEFFLCLEGIMNSQRISIKNEFDIISVKNPVDTDDYGPESYMVKLIKYSYSHINASSSF